MASDLKKNGFDRRLEALISETSQRIISGDRPADYSFLNESAGLARAASTVFRFIVKAAINIPASAANTDALLEITIKAHYRTICASCFIDVAVSTNH